MMNGLTIDRLRELLAYDPVTGHFVWKSRRRGSHLGVRAGTVGRRGYRRISIDYKLHYAHRLAWFFVFGEPPKCQIDHINCCPDDNRIDNLREADDAENARNSRKSSKNTSGYKGVSLFRRDGSWRAQIRHNGENIHLGYFPHPEDAHEAYIRAAKSLFGEFARAN